MTVELEELAETVEAFYEDAVRFRMVVEQYEQRNVDAERVEDAYREAQQGLEDVDAGFGGILEGWATGRLDAAMREPHEERRVESRSAAALAESIDATYLEAVLDERGAFARSQHAESECEDAYDDARHTYSGTLP